MLDKEKLEPTFENADKLFFDNLFQHTFLIFALENIFKTANLSMF